MDVSALRHLEAAGAHLQIESYLNGSAIPQGNTAVYQYASQYFVRRGKPAKSLEYYSLYLQQPEARPDSNAVQLAIDCAHRLKKPALVRDYFLRLTPAQREKLPSVTLMTAAEALISLGDLDDAEKILGFIRHRQGIPQLVSFDALIEQKFGSLAGTRKYLAENSLDLNDNDESAVVKKALAISLAHLAAGDYKSAEKILETCKAKIAA
jgi:Tfp pilus assembly protein PilF